MAFSVSPYIEISMLPLADKLSRTSLGNLLAEQIKTEGPIPFSEFMSSCLYHPEFGYYMSTQQRIGRLGDFFTSSSVHEVFGQLIALQIHQMWQILGSPEKFVIAEQGAGTGHLCLDILSSLKIRYPDFYQSLTYCIVEISQDNRCRQSELLASYQDRVTWCQQSDLADMVGCYLSNELVDAFPVHLVETREGQICEVFVNFVDDDFCEVLQPPSTDALVKYLEWVEVGLAEGNRAEINLFAPLWIRNVARLLKRGFVLTIDYGYLAKELYAPWRTTGTLMAYHQHKNSENFYGLIGEQDLTAHVDFTALIKAGEESGLQEFFYGDQCRFLLGLGFVEALLQAQAKETEPHRAQALRLTLKNLILPEGGMGEVFKVLIQGKDVRITDILCARSLRDLPLPSGDF